MRNVIINIGSNLGDRRLNLSRAVRAIASEFGPFELSHVVETEPQGFDSKNKFLNCAMMVQTDLDPHQVLQTLQRIERQLGSGDHRNPDGSYRDRTVDIDIMAIDDLVVDSPDLKIPHPGLPDRVFFLQPMAEIVPGWTHPVTGLSPMQMLDNIPL